MDAKSAMSKVPAVTLGFWLIKILATTLGETAGDSVTMTLHAGYLVGSLIFVGVLAALVVVQIVAKRFHPAVYWATIVASTTAGTTLADFADRSLGIGYAGGSTVLLLSVLGVLGLWFWSEKTVSVDTVSTPRVEAFYWATITLSQTLGTALGDWTADTAGMGYLGAAGVFGAALALVAAAFYWTKISRVLLFWAAFILTRPLGAAVGDFLDKPLDHGGLALSRPLATAVIAGLMIAGIVLLPQRAGILGRDPPGRPDLGPRRTPGARASSIPGRGTTGVTQTAVAEKPASTGFGAYLFAHGVLFLTGGVQMVLFPYLVRVVLHENAIRFGFAQMSLQLPTTLLILIGGFMADRVDGRRTMVVTYAATSLAFLALGLLVASGRLSYGLLIAYALVVGTIGAFASPARDSLLSQVAPRPQELQSAVAGASMAQFGGQIVGMLLAILAPVIGVASLLLGQAGLVAMAAVAVLGLRPRPAGERRQREGMGICFMGAFAVLLPLVVQSHFAAPGAGGNTAIASAFAVFSLCFWVGSMISAMVLMRLGPLRRKGRAYLAALMTGASVLLLCALPVPLWLLCVLNFFWGLCGGVAMTLSRGLVQAHAPAEKRARVLSIFTLGMMGGGPIGAVAYGFLAHAIGPGRSIVIPAVGMFTIALVVALRSRLWSLEDEPAAAT